MRARRPLTRLRAGERFLYPGRGALLRTDVRSVGGGRPDVGTLVAMFVGRDRERRDLATALGTNGSVAITGPPGIGKSTLAHRVADQVGVPLLTRGIATLSAVPFLLFRDLIGDEPTDAPEELAGRVLRTRPAVLLLEDLQWADPASIDVIGHLVGRIPMVATVRSGAPETVPLLRRLPEVGFEELQLGGLPPEDATDLARRTFPSLTNDQLETLVSTADGNPLLLTEIGRGSDVSPSLIAALLDRLTLLSDDGLEAMDRLSVLGHPAPAGLLGPGADEVVASGLAHRSDDLVEVHHTLLAELVVERLGDRATAVARELARLAPPFEQAQLLTRTGDRAGARAAARAFADQAGSRRERAEGLLLVVTNAPDGELDADERVEAARLLQEFGRPLEALECCALDRLLGDEVSAYDRGRLVGVAAYSHWLLGDPSRFVELIDEAIGLLRGSRTEAEVLALGGSTLYATWIDLDGRSARDRAIEAVRLADEIGKARSFSRTRLASVLSTSGMVGWVEVYQEAIELARQEGDVRQEHEAAASLMLAQWSQGDLAAARRVAAQQLERVSRTDFPHFWSADAAVAALLDLLTGVAPATVLERWQAVAADPVPCRNRPFLEAAIILALADQGLDEDARRHARGFVDRAGGGAQWRAVARWTLSEVAWLAGDDNDVLAQVDHLADLGVGDYPPAVMARLLAAHVAVAAGCEPTPPEPSVLLPAWEGAPIEWRALAAEHLGDHRAAVTLFEQAADRYVGRDVRSQARCLWAAARATQSAGDDAVPRLLAAEAFADQHGYRALLRRIHPLLRRSGITRSAPTGRTLAGLTTRELEVLDRVGEGLTSGQIANQLGIGRDTVDDLVRSALRRLGVANRRAAVAKVRSLRSSDAGDELPPRG